MSKVARRKQLPATPAISMTGGRARQASNTAMPRRRRGPSPPLHTSDGRPIRVVHIVAELAPFARSGGLGEAVNSLARFQSASRHADGDRHAALRHGARERAGHRAGRRGVHGAGRAAQRDGATVAARRAAPSDPLAATDVYFIESEEYFARPCDLRSAGLRLSGQRAPLRVLHDGRARRRCRRSPATSRCCIHAHDWHAALAPVYLRTHFAGDERYQRVKAVLSVHNAGFQGHFPRRGDGRSRAAAGAVQLASARVVRPRELAEGRTRLRRRGDDGEPDARARAAHGGRRLRPRRRVRRRCAIGSSGSRTGSTSSSGIRRPIRFCRRTIRVDSLAGKIECREALQRETRASPDRRDADRRDERAARRRRRGSTSSSAIPTTSRSTRSSCSSAPASRAMRRRCGRSPIARRTASSSRRGSTTSSSIACSPARTCVSCRRSTSRAG